MPDVLAILHAVEMNRVDRPISLALCLSEGVAERRHREHPPAGHHDAIAVERGSRMEDDHVRMRFRRDPIEALDHRAFLRRFWIAARGQDDRQRDAPVPFGLDTIERSRDAVLDQVREVAFQARHDRLRLGIAQPAVELEHRCVTGAVDHHPRVQKSGVGNAVGRHSRNRRRDHVTHDARMHGWSDDRRR